MITRRSRLKTSLRVASKGDGKVRFNDDKYMEYVYSLYTEMEKGLIGLDDVSAEEYDYINMIKKVCSELEHENYKKIEQEMNKIKGMKR